MIHAPVLVDSKPRIFYMYILSYVLPRDGNGSDIDFSEGLRPAGRVVEVRRSPALPPETLSCLPSTIFL